MILLGSKVKSVKMIVKKLYYKILLLHNIDKPLCLSVFFLATQTEESDLEINDLGLH